MRTFALLLLGILISIFITNCSKPINHAEMQETWMAIWINASSNCYCLAPDVSLETYNPNGQTSFASIDEFRGWLAKGFQVKANQEVVLLNGYPHGDVDHCRSLTDSEVRSLEESLTGLPVIVAPKNEDWSNSKKP